MRATRQAHQGCSRAGSSTGRPPHLYTKSGSLYNNLLAVARATHGTKPGTLELSISKYRLRT